MRARTSSVRRDANGALTSHAAGADPFDDMRAEPELNGADAAANHATSDEAKPRVASMRRTASKPNDSTTTDDQAHDHPHAHEPLGPDDPLAPLPFNPYKGNRGVTRAWHAMKNSLAGFRVAIREESAFRQELTLAAILLPCGVAAPVDPVSRVLLLGSVLLVLIVELLNSSVEAAIDRISLERHELSRRAKDLGSAAVMVALFMCVMTWALIVGPLVWRWISMLL